MKLHEAINEVIEEKLKDAKIRRESWTHGDSFVVRHEGGYMGGELYYNYSGNRASLFYVDDLTADDWCVE